MDKKASKHNEKEKPNWDWAHIECYLKTVEANRKSTIWNLAPSIILTNPSSESSGPNVRLYIDTEKSLQYSNDLGWNWHKSWNIPNISLRLEVSPFPRRSRTRPPATSSSPPATSTYHPSHAVANLRCEEKHGE
jgi:hypothetical protein